MIKLSLPMGGGHTMAAMYFLNSYSHASNHTQFITNIKGLTYILFYVRKLVPKNYIYDFLLSKNFYTIKSKWDK